MSTYFPTYSVLTSTSKTHLGVQAGKSTKALVVCCVLGGALTAVLVGLVIARVDIVGVQDGQLEGGPRARPHHK